MSRENAGLLLFSCPLRERSGVGCYRGADEFPERRFVDRISFVEIDRPPNVSLQAGVEEFFWILERSTSREGELHGLLVRFSGADNPVMRPDRDTGRFRFFPL